MLLKSGLSIAVLAFTVSLVAMLTDPYRRSFDVTQWDDPLPVHDEGDTDVRPFTIPLDAENVDRIMGLVAQSRAYTQSPPLPRGIGEDPWGYGVDGASLADLVKYWVDEFKWPAAVSRMNRLPHFTTTIHQHSVHFIHIHRSDDAPTVLALHGWPGSFLEFEDFVNQDAVADVNFVIPSLPGYGFSQAPTVPGMDVVSFAQMFAKLMARLYPGVKYVVQGGDWGGMIGASLAQVDAANCAGLHANFFPMTPHWTTNVMALAPSVFFTPLEIDQLHLPLPRFLGRLMDISGYMHQQATRPDTLGFALSESPVGYAAWLLEKFRAWGDTGGDVHSQFSRDTLLTNIMLYLTTDSVTSAMRLYKESLTSPRFFASTFSRVTVPTALADFPFEMSRTPRFVAASKYSNIVSYASFEKGGHFAALEQPELLAGDLAKFLSFLSTTEK